MQQIINCIEQNNYSLLTIILSIFILSWLYKTIFTNLQSRKNQRIEFIDKSIEMHSNAIVEIDKNLKLNINNFQQIYTSLYNLYKYTDDTILEEIQNYINNKNSATLLSIKKLILKKIDSLRTQQLHTSIIKKPDIFLTNVIKIHLEKCDLDLLLYPILYILELLLGGVLLFMLIIYPFILLGTSSANSLTYTNYLLYIFNFFIWMNLLFIILNNLCFKTNNKNNTLIYILSVFFFPLEVLLIYLINIALIELIITILFLFINLILCYKNLKTYTSN